MKKIYELGYGSYEESGLIQLVHDREFTIEHWDGIVFRASIEAAQMVWDKKKAHYLRSDAADFERYAQEDEAAGDTEQAARWRERCDPDKYCHANISFQYMYRGVAEILIRDHGFDYLKPDYGVRHSTYFMGWDNLAEDIGFNESREDSMLSALSRAIRETVHTGEEERYDDLSKEAHRRWMRDNASTKNSDDDEYAYTPLDAELLRAFGIEEDEE